MSQALDRETPDGRTAGQAKEATGAATSNDASRASLRGDDAQERPGVGAEFVRRPFWRYSAEEEQVRGLVDHHEQRTRTDGVRKPSHPVEPVVPQDAARPAPPLRLVA